MVSEKVTFYVQPGARRTEIISISPDMVVRIKVNAPPIDGKANEALLEFIKDSLKVRRSAVKIVHGEKSRTKVILIEGMDAQSIIDQFIGMLKE